MAATDSSGASSGSTRTAGLSTAIARDRAWPARGRTCGRVAAVEAPHVEVVDDVVDQVADVLDEGGVGIDVAGDAEPAEHLLAEAVGGGDRRGVEVGERAGEALAPLLRPRSVVPFASSATTSSVGGRARQRAVERPARR